MIQGCGAERLAADCLPTSVRHSSGNSASVPTCVGGAHRRVVRDGWPVELIRRRERQHVPTAFALVVTHKRIDGPRLNQKTVSQDSLGLPHSGCSRRFDGELRRSSVTGRCATRTQWGAQWSALHSGTSFGVPKRSKSPPTVPRVAAARQPGANLCNRFAVGAHRRHRSRYVTTFPNDLNQTVPRVAAARQPGANFCNRFAVATHRRHRNILRHQFLAGNLQGEGVVARLLSRQGDNQALVGLRPLQLAVVT